MTFSALFAVSAVNYCRSMSIVVRPWFVVEKKSLNPEKPEITNYKHQITNKFQISISKSQLSSNANCLGF
jgi:outer membrane phospholipase A